MRSIETRVAALEKTTVGVLPVHRMLIGESEHEARRRLGLSNAEVMFIQRVIVTPGGGNVVKH